MKGTYFSTKNRRSERYDSSYELRRFVALDDSPIVRSWTKRHGLRIPYRLAKRRRRYVPDIRVEYHDGRVFLEEIKGKVWSRMEFGAKNLAALSFCVLKGMTFRILFREQLDRV